MKIVKLLVVLIGCLLGYKEVSASALADTEQSSGPITIPYQITAIATKNAAGAGKVIIAGYYENAAGYKQLFIGREKSDGTALDTSFGTCYNPPASGAISSSGYTILGYDSDATISATANWIPSNVIIDAANKVVVVGTYQDTANTTAPQQGFIARFTSAGALDTTFGSAAAPNQGYCLYGPSDLSLPSATPITPIAFNSVLEHIDAGLTISRYVIVGTGSPQGIVIAIQDVSGGADGQLDTTFNGTGVFTATGDTLGGAATDSVVFNSLKFYTDAAFNLNYYIAGSVKISGILLALSIVTGTNITPGTPTSPVALQNAFGSPATGGGNTGYLSVPGNLLGGSAGASVVFNQLIQSNTAPYDWYLIGQIGGNTAFLASIFLAGSSINNSSFNPTAETTTAFGKIPGVVIINSSQLGQTGTVQFSSLIQKADTNYYISGVAGNSSFIASILNLGTGFNTAFGQVANPGYIAKTYTQVGLLEAPNVTQALWDATGAFFYLLSSDTLASSPGVRSSVAKILANGTALSTGTYTGTVLGVTNPFIWTFNYLRNTNIAGASTNINVTILQTPVGQAIQLLSPTDNPLLPPAAQQISIPGLVFDMTYCIYDPNAAETIVVGAVYLNNAGAGETNAYIARFDSNLNPDTAFGSGLNGYQNFDASVFGGSVGASALFFSVLPPDVNGNYTVCGSVNLSPYAGLIAQITTAGAIATANFNSPRGYKTYTSAQLGGTTNNAVLVGILKNTNFYTIGMTDVTTAIAVPALNSTTVVNAGKGVIAQINPTTGAVNTHFQIITTTFGLTGGTTQLCRFIQHPSGYFVVAANLPGTTLGLSAATNRAGICAINNDLTSLYTPFGFGNLGYTLMDSSTFGILGIPDDRQIVRFENLQLLTDNDLLLLGKINPNTAAASLTEQTLVVQMKPTGVFNTRLNGTGYLLGTTDSLKQGTMTAYSENVISIVGTDGGIFIFGSGVAGGTTNLVEIALIKRYGL